MPAGASDYLAAERTFLAWIRTGLALMGFGFVVARFGLFLRALQATQLNLSDQSSESSFWFGTALIVLGVIVNVWSARHHVRLVRDLNRGEAAFDRPSSLAVIVSLVMALVGLAMATYLIDRVKDLSGARSHLDRFAGMGEEEVRAVSLRENMALMKSLARDAAGFIIMSGGGPSLAIELALQFSRWRKETGT